MILSKILEYQAAFTRGSGFKVETDVRHSWVSISRIESDESTIFMQGDEGSDFIDEVDRLWSETGNLTQDTIAEALALPYIEVLDC